MTPSRTPIVDLLNRHLLAIEAKGLLLVVTASDLEPVGEVPHHDFRLILSGSPDIKGRFVLILATFRSVKYCIIARPSRGNLRRVEPMFCFHIALNFFQCSIQVPCLYLCAKLVKPREQAWLHAGRQLAAIRHERCRNLYDQKRS